LRFQNCFSPTFEISTMLLLCEMGVSGFGRAWAAVHHGMTNEVRFSYSANRRSILTGALRESVTLGFLEEVDFSYAETALEFSGATSNR
jgi:hypothetical protein